MSTVILRWWAILAAILSVQIGNGLAGLTISLKTEAAGFDAALMGWVIAAFYSGQILGPLLTPLVLRFTRMTPAFFGFTILAGASVYGFTLTEGAPEWMLLRFLQGLGMSAMFTVVEGWLNLSTGGDWRARTFAVYIMTQLIGLILGQLGVNLGGTDGTLALTAAALFMGGSGLLLVLGRLAEPHGHGMSPLSPLRLLIRAPGACVALGVSGLNWALMMGVGPVFAERMALTRWEVSVFMALTVLGGLCAQFPLGHWADHSSRAKVLSLMGAGGALVCLFAFLLSDGDVALLWLLALTYGAATFPIYAIAAALAGEPLEQHERIAASASMVWIFGIGATVAPILGAQAMAAGGPPALFAVAAMSLAAMVLSLSLNPWSESKTS
jgi:MFS family permease